MDFRETIAEIFSHLTGDAQQDIAYLREQSELYKDDENATEILRAIGRKIYSLIPDEEKEEFENLVGNDVESVNRTVEEALFLLKQNQPQKAEKMLASLIAHLDGLFQPDEECNYFCFANPLEEILYQIHSKSKKTVRKSIYDFVSIYYYYGYALIENGKLDEAEMALQNALRWNPVSVMVMKELGEIYKIRKDFDEYLKWTKQILKFVYSASDIARCYRNLGYYYTEIEKYDIASALYYLSIEYEQTEIANAELFYIAKQTGTVPQKLPTQEMKELFEKYHIPFGADKDVLGIAYQMGKSCYEEKEYYGAYFCFHVLFELTKDEEIQKMLQQLETLLKAQDEN